MSEFASNEDFYSFIGLLAKRLSAEGFQQHGQKLHFLIHEVAWTTSAELFGELGSVLIAVQREAEPHLPVDVSEAIARSLATIRRIWPDLG
jgi:hypothetical protein